MPGQKYHNATGMKTLMEGNKTPEGRAYELGLEAPDHLKKFVTTEEDLIKLFKEAGCEEFVPSWDKIKNILQNGHFGYSSEPGFDEFFKLDVDILDPFWTGYVTHLVGDKMFYNPNNGGFKSEKFNNDCINNGKDSAKTLLHHGWDLLNKKVDNRIPNVELSKRIEDLNIVGYAEPEEGEQPEYVNEERFFEIIDEMRDCRSVLEVLALGEISIPQDYWKRLVKEYIPNYCSKKFLLPKLYAEEARFQNTQGFPWLKEIIIKFIPDYYKERLLDDGMKKNIGESPNNGESR